MSDDENVLRHKKGTINGYGALRSILEEARLHEDCGLGELTVLSAAVDPYRLDTAAGHRDGAWLAKQFNKVVARGKKIHWRGLHYAIVVQGNIKKPNSEIYRNDDDNWSWLSDSAGKAARWLGYIPFDRISDNRNSPPIIHRKARVKVASFVSIGLDVTIPDADDINPTPLVEGSIASPSSARRRRSKMSCSRSRVPSRRTSTSPRARSPTRCCIRWRRMPTKMDARSWSSRWRIAIRPVVRCR
jgi:hypothetical protein